MMPGSARETEGAMKKSELTCSIAMARLLANIPEGAELGSLAIFVGVKGSGIFMGSRMDTNPEEIAAMLSAFGAARRELIEGIIREHGMELMISVLFFLASNQADTKDLGDGPADILKNYFIPKPGEEG
jgi:hypothetical protein